MKYFKLYYDKARKDKLVWEVSYSDNSHKMKYNWYEEVFISVPVMTKYYGPEEEVKAVIKGKCKNMEVKGNKLYIT